MIRHDPSIFDAVPLATAVERTGLTVEGILVLTVFEEPSGSDGTGPMRPVIRSYASESGLLVSLPDAVEVAPAVKAIMAEEADPWA